MKKINYIKIILDVLMALVFVILFNKNALSGQSFHEIAGLTIGLAFLIHIIINFKWVKQITINFFSSKMKLKARICYIIDLLLLIDIILIIGTGISISQVLFSGVFGSSSGNQSLHISLSYMALLLIGIHIGLHWGWVMNVFKNTFKINCKGMTCKIINAVLVIALFAFGSYNIYSNNYFSKIIPGNSVSQKGQGMGKIPSGGNFNPGSNNNTNPPNTNNDNSTSDSTVNSNTNTSNSAGTNSNTNNNSSADINNSSRPAAPNGGGFNGPGAGGRGRGAMSNSDSSNILNTILINLSIISFFSIIAFYIEKLLKLKTKAKSL